MLLDEGKRFVPNAGKRRTEGDIVTSAYRRIRQNGKKHTTGRTRRSLVCPCSCEYNRSGYCFACGHHSTFDGDYGNDEEANEG